MIRLKTLLSEITLNQKPYATQFSWGQSYDTVSTEFMADNFKFTIIMYYDRDIGEDGGWELTFKSPNADGDQTVAHSRSAASGQINYLRLISTVLEALFDFIDIASPEVVNITGVDPASEEKQLQKTRIYRELLKSRNNELLSAGYKLIDRDNKLLLVRVSNADSSGIE